MINHHCARPDRGRSEPAALEMSLARSLRQACDRGPVAVRGLPLPGVCGLWCSLLSGFCAGLLSAAVDHGRFESLGVPVTKPLLMATAVGPDATGKKDLLYFDFAQTGATLFLVVVDPDTGEATQYKSPVGPGAWAMIRGPDDKIYLGTWESGYVLKFDPQEPAKGIRVLGKPSPTETYLWQFALGQDGKLYGCTYGNAKLVSYDPKTGAFEDLGRMDVTQMYTRTIACGPTGKIYTGIGFGRANLVRYDPVTRAHKSILPEPYRRETVASVHLGADGDVYAHCGAQAFRIEDDSLVPIAAGQVVAPKGLVLRDGRTVTVGEVTATQGSFTLTDPRTGAVARRAFSFQGDGALLFVLGPGPDGRIYGSTAMPLEMFAYDPSTGKSSHLGNPTAVNGELYSILLWKDRLFVCAYPGSYLSVYDPRRPFKFGTNPEDNPRGFGPLGDGHLRPRAMILGPGEKLYIGSLPPYGQLGGALAVFDLESEKVVANFRHLVTNQSIVSLAFEPRSGLIFGGTSVAGGGGSKPSESEARFFAFDPERGEKIYDIALEPGVASYPALCPADGKVFAAAANKLLVFDPATREVTRRIVLPASVLDISLGRHRSGLLYGLTRLGVFVVDPGRGQVIQTAASPAPVNCGFALTDDAIYFGSGAQLWRYALP